MELFYKGKIPLQGLRSVRITLFVLFAASSMIMVSFHISSRNIVPQLRGASEDNCKTYNLGGTRILEGHYNVAKDQVPSRTSKIPSLLELKSLRTTIDKVITVIEDDSGVKSGSGTREKVPPPLSSSLKIMSDRELRKRQRLKEIKANEIKFLKSLDKNMTNYYAGTFVRSLNSGKVLPKPKDAIYMNITRLVPAGDVPIHPMSQLEPYKTRMLEIQDSCQKNPNGDHTVYADLKRIITDDDHRVLLCVIPKAACTTWKSIMYYLTGKSELEHAFEIGRADLVIDIGKTKSISRLSKQGIIGRMNNYTKFMVTRHPFSRLVSAFRNKFERREPSYVLTYGRRIAQQIIEEYLNGYIVKYRSQKKSDVLSQITSVPTFQMLDYKTQMKVLDVASRGYRGNITFEEFLRYGVTLYPGNAATLDVHWRPQHFLCNPCAINYDFMVRFEDLERESTIVLDYIQRNDPLEKRIKFPGGNPAAVTTNVTKKFFEKIPPDLTEKIRKIYEKDFQYFNYDPYHF